MRPLLERLASYLPAAIAITVPTAFVPIAVDSFVLPRASIAISGACLGVGLALLLSRGPGLGPLRLPLIAGLVAAILAFAFSVSWPLSLAGSYTRYESLPMRLGYLGLLAVPVWLLPDERSRNRVVIAFVLGTAIACLEAIQQAASGVPFRPDGNVGNANLLAALIAMAGPLALARALRGGRFVLAWWAALVVIGGGLFATTSRSGGLGLLAGCLALGVFALKGKTAAGAAIASTVAIGVALVVIVISPLRLINADPGPTRLHLWPDALHMVAARPLTGWGEDTTGLAFGRFLSGDWSPGVTFDRAHSGPLDIAATQGVLGDAALAWVLFTVVRGAWRRRFTGSVGALMAACIGYTVWVSFNFDWAPATAAFWLLAGTAWSWVRAASTAETPAGDRTDTRPRARALRSVVAVGLALAAVWLGVMPVLADIWYFQGRSDLSVLADPLQARYHRVLGENLVTRGLRSQGVDELRLAARLGETDPALYVELGDQEQQLREPALARGDYRMALVIDPYFAPAQQRLAASGSPGSS